MSLAVIFIYLAMVLVLGALSHKLFRNTGEDYFVASRTINWFILLMTLFGTNMTAFSILGASGEAYHRGIGVFALMASSSAIVVPCVFLFIGTRLWRLGKRFGYVTQVQYFRDRWESDGLGLLLFVATPSIFRLAVWSFTGFAGLFPIVVAALFWQRSTKQGVFAAIISVILLWFYFLLQNWQTPGYSVGGIGIMPAAVLIAVSAAALIIVSLLTKPPKLQTLEKFFNE